MMRLVLPLVALILAAVAPALVAPRQASACSVPSIAAEQVPGLIERAEHALIGEWITSSEGEATLHVHESLKGAPAGETLTVYNAVPEIGADCSLAPGDEDAPRFETGARSLVVLDEERDGAWWVAHFGLAAWPLPDGDREPLTMPGARGPDAITLADFRAGAPPADDTPAPPGSDSVVSTDDDSSNRTLVLTAGIALAVILTATGALLLARRRT